MKLNSNLRPYIGIAIGIVLTIVFFSLGVMWQCSRTPETPEKTETVTTVQRDTVTLWRERTITVSKPTPVYSTITKTVHDTLPIVQHQYHHTTDTIYAEVEVPITSSKFSDTQTLDDSTKVSYNAVVSGYKPSLDSLSFRVKYPERTINTSTVTTTTSVKKKHWGIGPAFGVGYGLTSKKFDAYVGLSVTYSF